MMDQIISELKESPTKSRVDELISSLLKGNITEKLSLPNSLSLDLFSTLINRTLPQLDDGTINPVLVDLFTCLTGISSLVAKISALAQIISSQESKLSDQVANFSHMNLLCEFLLSILESDNVLVRSFERLTAISNISSRLYTRELIGLFAGSKIFETVSMASHWLDQYTHQMTDDELKKFNKWRYLAVGSEYTGFLISEICSLDNATGENISFTITSELLEKTLKLGYPKVVAEKLLTKDHLSDFVNIFENIRSSGKWYIVESSILPFVQERYLNKTVDPNTISSLSKILHLFLQKCNSPPIFKYGESSKVNFNLRRLIVVATSITSQPLLQTQFNELLERWGNSLSVNHNPEIIQEAQTQMLILSLNYLDKPFLQTVSSSAQYLDAISNRLSALTDRIRLFGTTFAEQLSKLTDSDKPLKFGVEDMYDEDLKKWLNLATIKVATNTNDFNNSIWSLNNLDGNDLIEPTEKLKIDKRNSIPNSNANLPTPPDRITELDSDDEEPDSDLKPYPFPLSDQEDSDDDPTLVQKNKPTPPVYIKDLLLYLQEEDYNKNNLALIHGADLIRRKARFGQELDLYAEELSTQLAGMKDTFEMEKFNENRLIALSTLVASSPAIVPSHLAQLVFTGDYSLQQRINILSSITLGARELSGLKPSDSINTTFSPPKLLPPEVHKLFASPNDAFPTIEPSPENTTINDALQPINDITSELHNSILHETSQQVKDELISGPKVLRISSKLTRQRAAPNSSTKITTNNYAKLAHRNFFSPLVGQWYASGGVQYIGTYSDLLVAHFFKTLALLLHAAYPSSPDIPSMTAELLDLLLNQRLAANSAMPILDSVLTGTLIIIEINEPEFIISTWSRQIVELKIWLEDTWQSIPDEKTQSLAAGVLYKLIDLLTRWERRLIGEFTSLEGTQ